MELTKKQKELIAFIKQQINIDLMPFSSATKRSFISVDVSEFSDEGNTNTLRQIESLGFSSKKFRVEGNGYRALALVLSKDFLEEDVSMKQNIKEANQYTFGSEVGLDDVVDDVFSEYGKKYSDKEVYNAVEAYVFNMYEDFNRRNNKPFDLNDITKDLVAFIQKNIELVETPDFELAEIVLEFIEEFEDFGDLDLPGLDRKEYNKHFQEDVNEILFNPLVQYLRGQVDFYSSEEYLMEYWDDNTYVAFESPFSFGEYEKLPDEVLEALTENNVTIEDLANWIKDKGNHKLDVHTEIAEGFGSAKDYDDAIILWSSSIGNDEEQLDGFRDFQMNLTKEQDEYLEKEAKKEGVDYTGDYLKISLSDTRVTYYVEWDEIKKEFLKDMADK